MSLSTAGVDYVLSSPSTVNFPFSSISTSRDVGISPRPVFTGNTQFKLRLQSSGAGSLSFGVDMATVTIVDEQGYIFNHYFDDTFQLVQS